jgi:hypothetical protein
VQLINLVHDVDLLRHLFGNITRVYCEQGPNTRGHAVEETGACTLRFASDAVGTFIFSDAAASPYQFEGATGENPTMPHTVSHYVWSARQYKLTSIALHPGRAGLHHPWHSGLNLVPVAQGVPLPRPSHRQLDFAPRPG